MSRLVAALDADVLVPILSCDFLLTTSSNTSWSTRLVVSTMAVVEVERNPTADFPQLDPVMRPTTGSARCARHSRVTSSTPARSPSPTRSIRRTGT